MFTFSSQQPPLKSPEKDYLSKFYNCKKQKIKKTGQKLAGPYYTNDNLNTVYVRII